MVFSVQRTLTTHRCSWNRPARSVRSVQSITFQQIRIFLWWTSQHFLHSFVFSVFVVCLFLSSLPSVLHARLTDDDLEQNHVATVSPFVRETLEAIEQSITERNLVDARRFFDELLPSKADG
ncbi:MAG: hypothetical protein DWI13_00205, partial [Planctomycetota bacterium]